MTITWPLDKYLKSFQLKRFVYMLQMKMATYLFKCDLVTNNVYYGGEKNCFHLLIKWFLKMWNKYLKGVWKN